MKNNDKKNYVNQHSLPVIQGEKGYGVISAAGNIIFDPIYKKVDWEALPFEDDSYGHKMIFKCQADDGHYETINWDPRNR